MCADLPFPVLAVLEATFHLLESENLERNIRESASVMRSFRETKSFWLVSNVLLATSLVTLAVMIPLNSVIIAHPYEPVCVSCLVTVYAALIAFVTLWLCLLQGAGSKRLYSGTLKALTVAALIALLNVIQKTTIPSSWNTVYVIICVIGLLALVLVLVRGQREIVKLILMFALILSLYEVVNLVRIVIQANRLSPIGPNAAASPHLGHPVGSLPHAFLLVFDEFSLIQVLKDELLDRRIIPNLAEFSEAATWYRQAITLYASTGHAIPSLLTGRTDVGDFVEEIKESKNDHLFYVVSKTHDLYISGYALPYCMAFQAYVKKCLSFGLGFSNYGFLFRHWWDRAVPGELRKTGPFRFIRDGILRLFEPQTIILKKSLAEALRMGQDFSRPTFTYVHTGLPHQPYVFRANGDIRWVPQELRQVKEMTREELLQSRVHYREQIIYTDVLFGDFINQLKDLNLYDGALIVVTSDHGISFDPARPGRMISFDPAEPERSKKLPHDDGVARVPLFVKLPGQSEGRINDCPVSISGIKPAMLDALSLDHEGSHAVSVLEQC